MAGRSFRTADAVERGSPVVTEGGPPCWAQPATNAPPITSAATATFAVRLRATLPPLTPHTSPQPPSLGNTRARQRPESQVNTFAMRDNGRSYSPSPTPFPAAFPAQEYSPPWVYPFVHSSS
jgi:hypothetical protein